jgi:putative tryptophan/tyrosine transport system substrate-binding protein
MIRSVPWRAAFAMALTLGAPDLALAAKQVMIITNRGCEEVCTSFRQNLESQGEVVFIMRDIQGSAARLPALVAEARLLRPDLIATWGTAVTLGVVGRHDAVDPAVHVTDIPVVYMYVGNPVESKVARDAAQSGRPNVAGANTSVPIEAQLNLLTRYRKVERIAMLYNDNDPAAQSQASSARKAMEARGIAVRELRIPSPPDGKPDPATIEPAVEALAADKPDFLYYIGTNFTLANAPRITTAAIARGIPAFSSLESNYRSGEMLLGLISPLAGVGQIAAYQAGQILFHGKAPGSLPSPTLTRHVVLINMRAARALKAYPPIKLMQFAEIND